LWRVYVWNSQEKEYFLTHSLLMKVDDICYIRLMFLLHHFNFHTKYNMTILSHINLISPKGGLFFKCRSPFIKAKNWPKYLILILKIYLPNQNMFRNMLSIWENISVKLISATCIECYQNEVKLITVYLIIDNCKIT
jgi:hypothetical protein